LLKKKKAGLRGSFLQKIENNKGKKSGIAAQEIDERGREERMFGSAKAGGKLDGKNKGTRLRWAVVADHAIDETKLSKESLILHDRIPKESDLGPSAD
jgi:hypothetical protein